MKIIVKVLLGIFGFIMGEIILGYVLQLPQVIAVLLKAQTFNAFTSQIPIRIVIIFGTAILAAVLIIRMIINERKILEELRYTLYESLETLENYKKINEAYPSQVSEEDIERIKQKIKRIHQEIMKKEVRVPVSNENQN